MKIKWKNSEYRGVPWASIITTSATVILAIYAGVSHHDTELLLNQQKSSAGIQFRAYLGWTESSSGVTYSNQKYNIPLTLKNYGITPANNITINSYLENSSQQTSTLLSTTGQTLSLEPGSSINLNVSFPSTNPNLINELARGKNNFLILEIKYIDFQSEKHMLRITFDTEDPNPNILDVYDEINE